MGGGHLDIRADFNHNGKMSARAGRAGTDAIDRKDRREARDAMPGDVLPPFIYRRLAPRLWRIGSQ